MNEVLYCLTTILWVRFFFFLFFLLYKQENWQNEVKWHVLGSCRTKRYHNLPTKPPAHTTRHSNRPAEGTHLLPRGEQAPLPTALNYQDALICTSLWVLSILPSFYWKEGELPFTKHLSCSKHHVGTFRHVTLFILCHNLLGRHFIPHFIGEENKSKIFPQYFPNLSNNENNLGQEGRGIK